MTHYFRGISLRTKLISPDSLRNEVHFQAVQLQSWVGLCPFDPNQTYRCESSPDQKAEFVPPKRAGLTRGHN